MISENDTKATILAYVEELEDKIALLEQGGGDPSEEIDELARYRSRPHATMPDNIAAWLKVSSGKDVDPNMVMVMDVTPTSVIYKIRGNDNQFGIQLTASGELVDPPVHEHSWVRRNGAGGAEYCLCGENTEVPVAKVEVPSESAVEEPPSEEEEDSEESEEDSAIATEEAPSDPGLNE